MVKRNSEEVKIPFRIFCFSYGFNTFHFGKNLFYALGAPEIVPSVSGVLKNLLFVNFLCFRHYSNFTRKCFPIRKLIDELSITVPFIVLLSEPFIGILVPSFQFFFNI